MRRWVDVRLVALRFAGWGLLAGTALGALYGLVVVSIGSVAGLVTGVEWENDYLALALLGALFGGIFGAVAGLVGGIVAGLVAGLVARSAPADRPSPRHDRRIRVGSAVAFAIVPTAILGAVVASALVDVDPASIGDLLVLPLLFSLPVAIAAWVGWRLGARFADD